MKKRGVPADAENREKCGIPVEEEDREKLVGITVKCLPEDKAKFHAAITKLGGAQFATLVNSALSRMGFKFGGDIDVPVVAALRTCATQLLTEWVERSAEMFNELGNQFSASNETLNRTVTEAAAQQLSNDAVIKTQTAEINALREKNEILLRENGALRDSLEHAKRIHALHEERKATYGLADQVSGLVCEIQKIKDMLGEKFEKR
jgi:hypothetical protein